MLHRDHIHIQSLFPQGAVLLLYRFCVEHVLIPRSLCILDCPVIFSVIKDCYRPMCTVSRERPSTMISREP